MQSSPEGIQMRLDAVRSARRRARSKRKQTEFDSRRFYFPSSKAAVRLEEVTDPEGTSVRSRAQEAERARGAGLGARVSNDGGTRR
jgi:hypothetical protein